MELVDSHELLQQNMANYGPYSEIVENHGMAINARNINDINIDNHINWVFNVFADGIDLEEIQSSMVEVTFADKEKYSAKYTLEDYLIQLIFWKLPTSIHQPLTRKTIFWNRGLTTGYICKYVNRVFIKSYISDIKRNNIQMTTDILLNMNIHINETFETFKKFTNFQMYLNNTLCLEDTLDFMNKYPEFNESMHLRLAGTPIQDVHRLGMEAANVQISYIMRPDSNHCLKPFFQSGECLATKQYKEVSAHVGPKPNGEGGIIASMIDASYLNGGLSTPEAYTVDASASRVAQMQSHENVGKSGDFARILELNSMDTRLCLDSRYKCDTKHTITRFIKDQATLNIYDGRYYRFKKIIPDNRNDEPDKVIDAEQDTWLIGRTIELYSPMTCASKARGEGVCYRCYGDLAYTNFNINIGVIATELVSSSYTQRQLSAKHILEAIVRELSWSNPIEDILAIDFNTIVCYDTEEYLERYSKCKLIINTADFDYEDENDDLEYNAFITGFKVDDDGVITEYRTLNGDQIFLSNELNTMMADKLKSLKYRNDNDDEDVDIELKMSDLVELEQLFLFHINNDELSRIVTSAKSLLNKGAETSRFTKDEILEQFCDINLSGGFKMMSIHYEIILANQMRDADDELDYPDWTLPDTKYQILTLDKSLRHNPSVTTSLQYQKIAQEIWKPITYIKKKSSMNDIYFMVQPQEYIHTAGLVTDTTTVKSEADVNMREAVTFNKDLIGKADISH